MSNLGNYPLNNDLVSNQLDSLFPDGWGIDTYLSPAEKVNEKPSGLKKGDANTFGDLRSYPGPDTQLLRAFFFSKDRRLHENTFQLTDVQGAYQWLLKQNPNHQDVHLQENRYE